jgi:hypothetical protein
MNEQDYTSQVIIVYKGISQSVTYNNVIECTVYIDGTIKLGFNDDTIVYISPYNYITMSVKRIYPDAEKV